jgi:hypothetical protein
VAPIIKPFRLAVIVATSLTVFISFTASSETAVPHVADAVEPWSELVKEAAERFAIPALWIRAVMHVESGGNVKAVSPKGAVGLMQIKPDTYAELRARYALGADPADPHDNILAGAAYLREMHDRFGASGFLAAYNAGPARYEDHLATGRPLPEETRSYVALLEPLLSGAVPIDNIGDIFGPGNWQSASLFVPRSARKADDASRSFTPPPMRSKTDRNIADLSALTSLPGGLFVTKAKATGQP